MKKGGGKKKTSNQSSKKVFKVKGDEEYDSESDLSIQHDRINVTSKARTPTRAAASKAKRRVTAAVKKEIEIKMDSDSSEDEYIGSDEDSDSSSEEDEVMKRAKERQAKAFENAKKGKGNDNGSSKEKLLGEKSTPKMKSANGKISNSKQKNIKSMAKGKKGAKKKQFYESSDDFASESGDDLSDVDMDALIDEAMTGCQLSVLHSFCWWRIVLGKDL